MTPRPPIAIPMAMTACPKEDHCVAVSTVVRPVTHTADTAVNNTSTNDAGRPVAEENGKSNSSVMIIAIVANTAIARRAGDVRARCSTHSRRWSQPDLRKSVS